MSDIETWLTEKVPRIHNWANREERFQNCGFHYEFWTCGTFAPDALQRLAAAKAGTDRYKAGWKDGPEVRQYTSRLKPNAVLDMLDQHFFNHPVARIERQYDVPADCKTVLLDLPLGDLIEEADREL